MKQALIIITVVALFLIAGCAKVEDMNNTTTKNNTDADIKVPESIKPPNRELVEKRGETTNIKEWSELLRRASSIQSWEFTVEDTENEGPVKVYQLERYQTVEVKGKSFDAVQMDRVTKKALSRCRSCGEKEFEVVDYDQYHQYDPYEMMTRFSEAEFLKTDMIGNDYVKIFQGKFGGETARIWVQEYYGYPLKIENSARKIEYKDITINSVQRGMIAIPFNSTIEGKKYWSWEHYLGILKTTAPEPELAA